MKIHATPTTDGTGIALDVDHPHNLQIHDAAFVKSTAVVLTPDEAADLHAELGRLLSRKRTPDDVLNSPEPGDEIRFTDGDIWRAVNVNPRVVHFIEIDNNGRVALSVDVCARAQWAQRSPRREACPRGTPNPWMAAG